MSTSRSIPNAALLAAVTASALALVLLSAACREGALPQTPDPQGVRCVGLPKARAALLDAHHPLIYRGVVSSLPPRSPKRGLLLLERLFALPVASAYALPGESPQGGARVTLTLYDAKGALSKPAPRSTESDAQGRFCLVAPRAAGPGQWYVLEAVSQTEGWRQRQLALHSFDADINASSEALSALALKAKTLERQDASARWLNLRALADSRLGLLAPLDASRYASQPELIAAVRAALSEDEAIASLLGSAR